jgi:hypothetical protein
LAGIFWAKKSPRTTLGDIFGSKKTERTSWGAIFGSPKPLQTSLPPFFGSRKTPRTWLLAFFGSSETEPTTLAEMPGAQFDVSSFRNSIAERACLRNSIAPGVCSHFANRRAGNTVLAIELPGQVRAEMEFRHEERLAEEARIVV